MSANGRQTERISKFVDLHLHPYVQNLPSYLLDTADFLINQDTMGPRQPEAFLVLMDVTSLYTNIPHQDGIKTYEEVWETRPVKHPPFTNSLIKLLTLVLKCNNFSLILNTIYKCKGRPWVQNLLHHRPMYCGVGWKNSCHNRHYTNTSVHYTSIFHGCKNGYFKMKNYDNFLIFAQNIDCGYTLEPPH